MVKLAVEGELGRWLEPATVELSSEQFAALRDAVGAMAKSLDVTGSLGLVRAAHGVLDGTNRAWLTEKARESDPALPHTGKDALLNVLAASAVMEVLATERHSKYGLITLLVKSALFCGWEPAIPDLIDAAERARHQLGRSVRRRDSASKSVAKEVKDALGGASDESEGATEVDGREAALGIVAERLDQTRAELLEVLMLQDEELNTLWWSYGGRSTTTNKLWSDIE